MSLRHTEANLRRTESSLPDCHTAHNPLQYSTQASAYLMIVMSRAFYYELSGL